MATKFAAVLGATNTTRCVPGVDGASCVGREQALAKIARNSKRVGRSMGRQANRVAQVVHSKKAANTGTPLAYSSL